MPSDKIIILGVDGLDPSLTKKYVDMGNMPNFKKIIDMGAQREDLVMLGAHPTITPPLWATLQNGAYPGTHGVTCFWNQTPGNELDTFQYGLDSRDFKAEPLWNVLAEDANKKTLVWHWPGGSWPPTSSSENLLVVDGTQPAMVGMGTDIRDWEKIIVADEKIDKILFKAHASNDSGAGCIITDVDAAEDDEFDNVLLNSAKGGSRTMRNLILSHEDGEDGSAESMAFDLINSPIVEPRAWSFDVPKDAKEFSIILSSGLDRRPCLILKDENGKYTKVVVYKSKKENEAVVAIEAGEFTQPVADITIVGEEQFNTARTYKLLEIAEDGSRVKLWTSMAMDVDTAVMYHPQSLKKKVMERAGYESPASISGGGRADIVSDIVVPSWREYVLWQARAINCLIDEEKCEVVFSHVHNVDAQGHMFWRFAKEREGIDTNPQDYQGFIEQIYKDTDEYLGQFMHLLDNGWTIFITSDHGLLCPEELPPLLGDAFGVNVRVMQKLGYTVLKTGENGNEIKEIDWEQTTAVASRGNHIYINLKDRDPHGIVDPGDKYELERKIIDDLYAYRDPETGNRIVAMAMRNKEARIIGLGGPNCGDIMYWLEEGANRLHGDALSSYFGYADTSVSPIFIAAGSGFKRSFKTDRVIRQIDFCATVAAVAGVRMPAQCEGGVMHQILE